ncbi:MAG: sugar transporter substrate-binding protein [Microbacteriaceae bacterium]|nr:sugar transporter substrate-binding protein [Microbacteriaceae bacterium]
MQIGMGAALLAVLAGCSTAAGSATTSSSKSITIGLSNQTMAGTFPVGLAKGANQEAKKLGIKLVVLDSKGDVQKQGSDMQDLVAQKVDGILIVPNSPGPAQAMVDQAVAAKIPVASVHGTVGTGPTDVPYSKLSFTMNESATVLGTEEAKLAEKALPNGGQVAIITGAAGFLENTTWTQGFKDGLAAKGGFTIVATQPGDWTPEAGQAACQGILSAHPSVDLFYAISDDMATGCAKAVAAAHSSAKILGNGGSAAGISCIKDGSIYGDVCYKPVDEGAKAVDTLYQQITGKTAASHKVLTYDTPAITLSNIDQCVAQW